MKFGLSIIFGLSILITEAQVGIGTTTPSAPLDIEADDAAIDINSDAAVGSRDPQIHFQLSGTSTFSLGIDDADSDKFKIGTTAPETGTALTIDGSQNVGIGNTAPTAKLDVDGSAIFNESGAAVDFKIEGDTDTELFYVDGSTDRIGIGTSSPTTKLDIHGGGIDIDSDDDGDGCGIFEYGEGMGLSAYINSSNDPLIVLGGGNAYVGIKNTSPNATLDVDGSAIFNDSGADKDFRIEGDTEQNLIFVDASADKVGIGTSSPTSGLDIQTSLGFAYAVVTTTTTLNQTHNTVLASDASGSFTITLPAAASNAGKVYYIKKTNDSENEITIDGNGAETIDGATTLVLYVQYDAIRILCDGSNWHIISDELKAHHCVLTRDAAQSISDATDTDVDFDNEEFDVGGIGDITTDYRVEIKRSGNYLISAQWTCPGAGDQDNIRLTIAVNNVAVQSSYFTRSASGGGYETANATTIRNLSSGDFVEISIYHDVGTSKNTLTGLGAKPRICVQEIR